jgi:uncharacterized membrane protein
MAAKKTSASSFFEGLDRPAIVEAIRRAESKGRGEIRVHLHRGGVSDAQAEAVKVFEKLGMTKTEKRSGCLIFIAPEARAFAVIGDKGIHDSVGDDFWKGARDAAAARFAEGKFTEGIVAAVTTVGEALAKHFPKSEGEANPNELPDDVTED